VDAISPAQLRFRLLGEATVCVTGADNHRVIPQKGLALLIYLAMHRGRPISRAVLADLLWGDRVDSQARQNLRQCVLTLRRDFGPTLRRALVVEDQSLALPIDRVEVDALQFVACAGAADAIERRGCLDLPWGPFLGGFSTGAEGFDEWAAAERQAFEATAVRAFADLTEQFDAAGDREFAIMALERLIAIDPAEEHRHRRLLALEARTRGADAALARGRMLAALLKREFDAEPESATLALLEDIRRSVRTQFEDVRLIATEPHNEAISIEPAATTPTAPLGTKRVPRVIAACAVTLFAMAGAALVWTQMLAPPAPIREQDLAAQIAHPIGLDGSPDSFPRPSWRSPPLPSRSAGETAGRERGLIAIVVLPFTSRGEQNDNMVADMMTDDLNNMLSRFPEFRVISGQTARSYRGRDVDAAAIGRELGVSYLLEGNVLMRDGQLRVNVGLVEAANQLQVWSHRFDRAELDRDAIQDEIVKSLGRELQIGVVQLESERGTASPDLHELIFKGWAALGAVPYSGVESLRQAERFFEQALSQDPDNVRAQAGLGAYHAMMGVQLQDGEPAAHLDKAEAIIRPLIDRHPNRYGPYYNLGLIYTARWQPKSAARMFERAIELNLSHAPSYAQLGHTLALLGRPDEGLQHIFYAMRLSPRDPALPYWLYFAGRAELERGDYEKAIVYAERAHALNPSHPHTMLIMAAAHALSDNMSAAHRQLDRLSQAKPHLSREKLIEIYGEANGPRQSHFVEGLRRALASTL
jgi:DNA-binding SARP family transcriptional activator/TolB-like protein/Tfp pilus assembly protein PilF